MISEERINCPRSRCYRAANGHNDCQCPVCEVAEMARELLDLRKLAEDMAMVLEEFEWPKVYEAPIIAFRSQYPKETK